MSRSFSSAEVATHYTDGDRYLIIHNEVYDVSDFIHKHPQVLKTVGKHQLADVGQWRAGQADRDRV